MKKNLLLSALVFSALASQATTFTVTIEGKEIQNGATVEAKNIDIATEEFLGTIYTSYQLTPEVYASASERTEVTVTVKNSGQKLAPEMPTLLFCWPENCIPGIGEPGAVGTVEGFLEPTPQNLLIDSTFWEGQPQAEPIAEKFVISCEVNIVSKSNASDTFSFNLNMVYDPVVLSVDGIEADDNIPAIYYDLAGRRILNPQKGQLIIERRGAQALKVIL